MPKEPPRFVSAYSRATGRKQSVPRHWIGHPVLGANWALTPSQRARDAARDAATEQQPPAYPATFDDGADAPEDLDTPTPPTNPVDDNTPDAGDDEGA